MLNLKQMKKLILLMILVAPFRLLAQKTVTGTVYDYENRSSPLQNVVVKNLSTQAVVTTKAAGQFNIAAKVGDVLQISFQGYHTDSLYLIDLQSKTIYLPPSSTDLREVKIQSTKVSRYLNVKPDPNAKAATRVNTDGLAGKKNTDRAGGISLAFGSGKARREKEKVQLLEDRDSIETEIRNNFNDSTVHELTKLSGKDLTDFVSMYRPTAARVRSEAPFNYSLYIAQAHQTWLKLPADQRRLPPVPKLKN
jgi:hypothetical protein